jgi:hypothetical protein
VREERTVMKNSFPVLGVFCQKEIKERRGADAGRIPKNLLLFMGDER